VIFCGKFHRFSSLLRYAFQINTAVENDPRRYSMYYMDAASDYLLYVEYLSTTNSLEVQLKMYTPGGLEHRTSYFRLGNNVVLYVTQKVYAQN
jgi:hypothetical protein